MNEIDARGKPCPQPVLLVKSAVDGGQTLFSILVDNQAAVENVRRFAHKSGYRVTVDELQGCWRITGLKDTSPTAESGDEIGTKCTVDVPSPAPQKAAQTLVIKSEALGHNDEELGKRLIAIFVNTLAVNERKPQTVILLNAGVRLACEGSNVLDAMRDLEEKGVRILACGTCLNHYNLNQYLRVGRPTDAYEILNIMLAGNTLVWG